MDGASQETKNETILYCLKCNISYSAIVKHFTIFLFKTNFLFKKWREKEEDFLVVFGANKFCTGKVVVEGGRWKERKKNPRVSSKLVVVVCFLTGKKRRQV